VTVDDVHEEFCVALTRAGGISCETLIPDRSKTRADLVFADDNVVVEVKTVTIDRNKVEAIRKKSGEIISSAAKRGGPVIFGTVSLPFDGMEQGLAEALLAHLGDRLRKELQSANRQIKATAAELGLVHSKGMVIVAVPAHFSLHAGFIATVAGRVLRPGKYRSIDGLAICSVPIDDHPFLNPLTYSFHPRSTGDTMSGLARRMGQAWVEHLSAVDDVPIVQTAASPREFEEIFLVGDEDWPKSGEAWKD